MFLFLILIITVLKNINYLTNVLLLSTTFIWLLTPMLIFTVEIASANVPLQSQPSTQSFSVTWFFIWSAEETHDVSFDLPASQIVLHLNTNFENLDLIILTTLLSFKTSSFPNIGSVVITGGTILLLSAT